MDHQEGGEEVLKELLGHRRPEEKEELWRNLRLDWVKNWDLSCQTAVLLSRLQHTGKERARTRPAAALPAPQVCVCSNRPPEQDPCGVCPPELSCGDAAVLWRYLTALHDQQRVVDWLQAQRTGSPSCWPEITPQLVNEHTACSTSMKETVLDLLARYGTAPTSWSTLTVNRVQRCPCCVSRGGQFVPDEVSDLELLLWRLAQGGGLMTSPPPLPQGLDLHSVLILFCLERSLQYLLYTYLDHYRWGLRPPAPP